jgi:hypothetical protein
MVTASGSTKDNPPAAYYKVLRGPEELVENTTHLFLATRFNCNKCHDHPFERWTWDQYYQTAAFFAQVDLKGDPPALARPSVAALWKVPNRSMKSSRQKRRRGQSPAQSHRRGTAGAV